MKSESMDANNAKTVEKYLIFLLGGELYGTPLLSLREVIEYKEPKPVPNTAKGFEGVINLRGEIVGIMDLRVMLNIIPNEQRCLLVFESDKGSMGAVVDRVIAVTEIPKTEIEKTTTLPDPSFNEYFIGIGKSSGRLITLIDLCRIPSLLSN